MNEQGGTGAIVPPLGRKLMSGAGFYLLRFLLTGMASIGINLYVMAAYPVHDVGYLAILFVVAATVVQLADLGIGAALIQSRSVVDDVLATQLYTNLLALWAPLLVVVCAAAAWWPSPLLLMSAVLVLTIPITAIRLLSSATLEQRFGFAAVASLDLAETAALVTVVFISAWWGIGVWGYVLGCVARAVVGWAIAGKLRAFRISLTIPRWDATWRGLLRFGLWFHAGTILTNFRVLVLPVSLASLIGLTAVAIVDRSIFIASAPAVILGTIQQRVLFPFFSATQDDPGRRRAAFEKAVHLSACLDKLMFLPLLLLLEPCIHFFLPTEYAGMVTLVWILALANAAFGAISSTAMPVFNGMGRSDLVAWLGVGGTAITWILAWPLVWWLGIPGAIIANMSAWLGVWVIVVVLCRQLPGVGIFRRIGVPFLAFVIALAVGWLVVRLYGRSDDLAEALVAAFVAMVTYGILLVVFDRHGTLGLAQTLRSLLGRRRSSGEIV